MRQIDFLDNEDAAKAIARFHAEIAPFTMIAFSNGHAVVEVRDRRTDDTVWSSKDTEK